MECIIQNVLNRHIVSIMKGNTWQHRASCDRYERKWGLLFHVTNVLEMLLSLDLYQVFPTLLSAVVIDLNARS